MKKHSRYRSLWFAFARPVATSRICDTTVTPKQIPNSTCAFADTKNWAILPLWRSDLSSSHCISAELNQFEAFEYRPWSIFDLWEWKFINLWLTNVRFDQSWTDEYHAQQDLLNGLTMWWNNLWLSITFYVHNVRCINNCLYEANTNFK